MTIKHYHFLHIGVSPRTKPGYEDPGVDNKVQLKPSKIRSPVILFMKFLLLSFLT